MLLISSADACSDDKTGECQRANHLPSDDNNEFICQDQRSSMSSTVIGNHDNESELERLDFSIWELAFEIRDDNEASEPLCCSNTRERCCIDIDTTLAQQGRSPSQYTHKSQQESTKQPDLLFFSFSVWPLRGLPEREEVNTDGSEGDNCVSARVSGRWAEVREQLKDECVLQRIMAASTGITFYPQN